jgi:hypothetical protein
MSKGPKDRGFLIPVEILQVDTANSRELYKKAGLNPVEKSSCQKILSRHFNASCRTFGGRPASWQGDGGHALFPSQKDIGLSFNAAEYFLHGMKLTNLQAAAAFDMEEFFRSVRIAIHRGEIYIAESRGLDSADPKHFDDFLKFAKKFAPDEDVVFITRELYDALPKNLKDRFNEYSKITAGSIRSALYMMNRKPIEKVRNILEKGSEVSEITEDEWHYVLRHIECQKINISSRNLITLGLVRDIVTDDRNTTNGALISSRRLFELTLNGLYNYLRIIAPERAFSVCYWIPTKKREKQYLQMYRYRYPQKGFTDPRERTIPINDDRFKAIVAFNKNEPIATPSVKIAANRRDWFFFDENQKSIKRDIASALQIPVYFRKDKNNCTVKGVLSIDTDTPNFFLTEEVEIWREELIHYLVNLCLASVLLEKGL